MGRVPTRIRVEGIVQGSASGPSCLRSRPGSASPGWSATIHEVFGEGPIA
jgi:hypothetical protein